MKYMTFGHPIRESIKYRTTDGFELKLIRVVNQKVTRLSIFPSEIFMVLQLSCDRWKKCFVSCNHGDLISSKRRERGSNLYGYNSLKGRRFHVNKSSS